MPFAEKQGKGSDLTMTPETLHIGNLAPQTTEEEVAALLAPYGTPHSISVQREPPENPTRAYALVTLTSPEATRAALAAFVGGRALNGHVLTARILPPRAAGWEGGNDEGGSNRSRGYGMANGGSRW